MIEILTWYKSVNHGAVLQAYGLHKFLNSKGYENKLRYYDRVVAPISYKKKFTNLFHRIINNSLIDRAQWNTFEEEKKNPFTDFIANEIPVDYDNENVDALIIGSDMVFDLRQGFNPYMFAVDSDAKNIISYAASAGGSTLSLAKAMGVDATIREGLRKFHALGCRDEETVKFVKSFDENLHTELTIDPVLLYGFENERKIWLSDRHKEFAEKHYVLVYSYHGNMDSKDEVNAIKQFAKVHSLSIISCGYYHRWCDESINASPKEFLDLFNCADYVITDTFHGTIFSIICKKQFISVIRGNGFKLEYLLNQSGLHDRILNDFKTLDEVINKDIDYETVDVWLSREREKSTRFLLSHLNGEKNGEY